MGPSIYAGTKVQVLESFPDLNSTAWIYTLPCFLKSCIVVKIKLLQKMRAPSYEDSSCKRPESLT